MNPKSSSALLGEDVKRESGTSARRYNLLAARLIADLVKNSLGPRGLDKMFIDILGEVTVTKDGATLLRKLDVEHPAAKVIIEASNSVDNEVGDGTTAVVVLCGALIEKAEELLDRGILPSTIIDGYSSALDMALEILADYSDKQISPNRQTMMNLAATCLASKSLSMAGEGIIDLIVEAVNAVTDYSRKFVDIDNIKIEEKPGEIFSSTLVKGIVIDKTIDSSSMPRNIENAKIMLIDEDLEGRTTRTQSQIQINSPEQMAEFKEIESDEIRSKVKHIVESGANVVFSRRGINTLAQHLLARAGIISVRRVKENDLIWLSKATGATIAERLDHEHDEHGTSAHGHSHSHTHSHDHDHSHQYSYHHGDIDIKLGNAARVYERSIGDDRLVFVEGCKDPKAVTLLLRAGSKRTLDEFHRSAMDAIFVLRNYIAKPSVVAGGGAIEAAVAKKLSIKANSVPGREQLVIRKFAEALEEIPITLARNAGMDIVSTIAKLRFEQSSAAGHNGKAQTYGIDVVSRQVGQMFPRIVEPTIVKEQVLKTATEVTNMLLRVDDVLMAKPTMNTHTHSNGTTHSHRGGDKEHQHDYFDRLGKMQRPGHHYY